MSRDELTRVIDSRPAVAGMPDDSAAETHSLRRRLHGLAIKLLWNRHDAEEVVQEAFMIALQKNQPTTDVAWMLRTVANLCLNLRRRKKAERLEDWVEFSRTDSPRDQLEHIEQLDSLRREIERLPAQQRIALVLRAQEGMEYAEIAGVMELTTEAVRTHVHLARRKLMEQLAKGDRR